MQSTPQEVSWLREFVFPASFTILGAIIGAALGFSAGQLRDSLKAKKSKKAFITAVSTELEVLEKQLTTMVTSTKESSHELRNGAAGPVFVSRLQSGGYATQIGRLRDVDDLLILKVIHFYSDLSLLEPIIEGVNEMSSNYNRASGAAERNDTRLQLLASIQFTKEHCESTILELQKLRAELTKTSHSN
jgi:hypothetical protein